VNCSPPIRSFCFPGAFAGPAYRHLCIVDKWITGDGPQPPPFARRRAVERAEEQGRAAPGQTTCRPHRRRQLPAATAASGRTVHFLRVEVRSFRIREYLHRARDKHPYLGTVSRRCCDKANNPGLRPTHHLCLWDRLSVFKFETLTWKLTRGLPVWLRTVGSKLALLLPSPSSPTLGPLRWCFTPTFEMFSRDAGDGHGRAGSKSFHGKRKASIALSFRSLRTVILVGLSGTGFLLDKL
jgi:hypothetical protein